MRSNIFFENQEVELPVDNTRVRFSEEYWPTAKGKIKRGPLYFAQSKERTDEIRLSHS